MLVPAQVVDQVCQGVVGRVPRKADHTAGHSVKALFHVPEHMFHLRPNLCVLPVDGVLPLADLLAFDISFDDSVLQAILPQTPLHTLAYVCAVSVQLLPCADNHCFLQ